MSPRSAETLSTSSPAITFSPDLAPFFERWNGRLSTRHDLGDSDWDINRMRQVALGVAEVAEAQAVDDGWVLFPARLVTEETDQEAVVMVLVFPESHMIPHSLFHGGSFIIVAGAVGSSFDPGIAGCCHLHPPLGSSLGLASLYEGTGSLGGYLEDSSRAETYVMTAGHVGAGVVDTDSVVQSPWTPICQPSNEDSRLRQEELERDVENQRATIDFYQEKAAERRIVLGVESDHNIQRLEERAAEAQQTVTSIASKLEEYLITTSVDRRHLGTVAYFFRAPVSFGKQDNGDRDIENAVLDAETREGLQEKSVSLEQNHLTVDWALVRSTREGRNMIDGVPISDISAVVPGGLVRKVGRTTARTTGRILRHRVFASLEGNRMVDAKGIRRRVVTREYAIAYEGPTQPPRVFFESR
ncbi:MAG: hypothetical protein M1819_004214 [Sarea resinae]|nr:MAG: hypothetical protein M1819_004214 [Sarea resinae]